MSSAEIPKPFRKIRTTTGERLITKEIWYHLSPILNSENTEDYVNFFKSKEWARSEDAFYELPDFEIERAKRLLEYELYLNKLSPPAEKVPCPRCGSTNVTPAVGKYTRALDEAGVAKSKCRQCGKTFSPE